MRNYNSKTHVPPNPINSFKKSDRLYPQPKKLKNQQPTVIIKQQMQMQNQMKKTHHYQLKPMIIKTNGIEKYSLLLQNQFKISNAGLNSIQNDGTCLWFKNLNKTMNSNKKTLVFKQINYLISNWLQDQFPNIIYICCDGIPGYLNQYNQTTTRVASLKLKQIHRINTNDSNYYQILYQMNQQTIWQIPQSLTYIYLSVSLDSQIQKITLPLPQPIVVQLQIRNTI